MALLTSMHGLRTLIRSFNPLVIIETMEEERGRALLQSVMARERMPLGQPRQRAEDRFVTVR